MGYATNAIGGGGSSSRTRLPPWLMVLVAASVTGLFAFVVQRYSRHSTGWLQFDDIGQAVAAALASLAAAVAAHRSSGRSGRGWVLVGLGLACWSAAQVLWTVIQVRTGQAPLAPSICDGFFLAADIFLVIGVVTFVVTPTRGRSQLSGLLEWLMISGGMLLAGWALLFGPALQRVHGSSASQLINISYPAFDIVIVSALLFAVARRARLAQGSVVLLALGLGAVTSADLSFWFLTTVRHYPGSSVSDAGWVGGFLMAAVAALSTPRRRRRAQGHRVADVALQALPEVTLLACTAAMIGGRLAGLRVRFDLTFMGLVVAVLAISVLHRLTLVVDNLVLTAGLEDRVRERTEELSVNERYFRTLVQRSTDVIAVIEPDLTIRDVTDSVQAAFGLPRERVIGRSLAEHNDLCEDLVAALEASATKPGGVSRAEWTLEFGGVTCHAESVITDLTQDPEIGAYVVNTRDVTDRASLEAEMRQLAFQDPLTSLANRSLFHDRVGQAIERIGHIGGTIGVMLIDLDGFKTVNDSLGHQAGDDVLVVVAGRLVEVMEGEDLVARLGGDEFAVLLERPPTSRSVTDMANVLLDTIRRQIDVDGQEFNLSASIGIVLSSSPRSTVESLIRDADIAMYDCKRNGKDQARHFEPAMRDEAEERFHLEAELRGAVERREIVLHYQPTVNLRTGRIEGFEALARWQHPRLGLLQPERFIPMAEETGLIIPLGRWVLDEAVHQLAAWSRSSGDRGALSIAVNVSARQLRDPDLVDNVRNAIDDVGIDPRRVVLELTESVLIADSEEVVSMLERLHDVGVRLAIDDFGTGYASMSYLQRLPIEVLKVDKTFVDTAAAAVGGGAKLLRAILNLGRTLGLRTVAEGIEDAEQVDMLRAAGCDVGQGFYFSRPVPAHQAWLLLEGRRSELVSGPAEDRLPIDHRADVETSERPQRQHQPH